MQIPKFWKRRARNAPKILLTQAKFLTTLGSYRAALVLYEWALALAPRDHAARNGQAEARRLAAEADTQYYWKRITGKILTRCEVSV